MTKESPGLAPGGTTKVNRSCVDFVSPSLLPGEHNRAHIQALICTHTIAHARTTTQRDTHPKHTHTQIHNHPHTQTHTHTRTHSHTQTHCCSGAAAARTSPPSFSNTCSFHIPSRPSPRRAAAASCLRSRNRDRGGLVQEGRSFELCRCRSER
jgi:hypothetical protein